MSHKTYSPREEKRILDALGRGLLHEFPNPERVGCPASTVLKEIAFHEMPLAQAEPWLDHLTSCSPCYRDFCRLREAAALRRKRALVAVAASILVVASLGAWALIHRRSEIRLARTVVLDLRNRSVARGSEPAPAEPPLEIARTASHLYIYLPLGSSEGSYEVRIVGPSGESVAATSGLAQLQRHITTLQVQLNLSSAQPGKYILQVRKTGLEWNSYPLILR